VKKVTLFDGPGEVLERSGWEGIRSWRLWSGARHGMLGLAEFDPGAVHGLHRHPNSEQCIYVLEGAGTHLGLNGSVELSAGQATFAPADTWHGFANSTGGRARLLTLFGGATEMSEAGFEVPTGDAEVDAKHAASATVLGQAIRADAALDPAAGFDGLDVYWLATADSCGATSLVLGRSAFKSGGVHELHRHVHAEEFLLIVDGGGYNLMFDAEEHLRPGDVALIEQGEWHGFRADTGAVTHAVFGYLGAPSLEAAGYEVRR
jgi:quercetin dioxygenase-like cupin family protein